MTQFRRPVLGPFLAWVGDAPPTWLPSKQETVDHSDDSLPLAGASGDVFLRGDALNVPREAATLDRLLAALWTHTRRLPPPGGESVEEGATWPPVHGCVDPAALARLHASRDAAAKLPSQPFFNLGNPPPFFTFGQQPDVGPIGAASRRACVPPAQPVDLLFRWLGDAGAGFPGGHRPPRLSSAFAWIDVRATACVSVSPCCGVPSRPRTTGTGTGRTSDQQGAGTHTQDRDTAHRYVLCQGTCVSHARAV